MGRSKGQDEDSGSKKKSVKFSSETEQQQVDKEESDHQKKAQLELKIRQRVASEARAFDVVNRLIEPNITVDFLQQACQFVDHNHYEDIVEERSIAHLCGYPLCNNALKKVSKQKYHISTRSNTVYDITKRKKFCSNRCYQCSEHLHRQIPETPVWSRRGEDCVTFDLLQPHTISPLAPGERVIGSHMFELREEVQLLEKLDSMEVKDTTQRSRTSAAPGGGGSSKSPASSFKSSASSSSSSADTNAEQNRVSHEESQRLSQELLSLSTEDDDLGTGLGRLSLGVGPGGPSEKIPGDSGDVKKEETPNPISKGVKAIVKHSSSDEARKPCELGKTSGDGSPSGEQSKNPVESSKDRAGGPLCENSSSSGSKSGSGYVRSLDGGEGSSENPREETADNESLCKEDGTEVVKGGKEQHHSGLESRMNKLTLRDNNGDSDGGDDDNLDDDGGENRIGGGRDVVQLSSSSGSGETQTSQVCPMTPVTKTQQEMDSDDDDYDNENEVRKGDKKSGSMSPTVTKGSEHSKNLDPAHCSATEKSEEKDKENPALISNDAQSPSERPQASHLQQQPGESKAAYLMRLLDRRKNLLSKVADVQSNVQPTPGQTQTLHKAAVAQCEVPSTSERTQTHGSSGSCGRRSSSCKENEENKPSPYLERRREDVETDNSQCHIESSENADSSQQLKKAKGLTEKDTTKESEAAGDSVGDETKKKSLQPGSSNSSNSRVKGREEVKTPAQSSKPCPLRAVCQVISSWISQDTLDYLGLGLQQQGSKEDTFLRDPDMQQKYQDLCQRLAGQEKDFEAVLGEEEVEGEEDRGGGRRKPLPDYAELKKQTQQYQERVQQFFAGPITAKTKASKKKSGDNGDTEGDDRPIVLPAIDCHNQLLIRRRIVLEKLDHTMPSLLPSLGLSVQDVSASLRELVFTFSLNSHNIIFKPAEWTLAAIVLLKMMESKIPAVQSCFASHSSSSSSSINTTGTSAFVLVLHRLGHSPASLTQLVNTTVSERSVQLNTPPAADTST